MPTAKKIVNLRWDETSGVDHSANEEEGWAVMKNADITGVEELDELIKQEAELIKAANDLTAQLTELKDGDVPKEVKDACDTILKFLEEQYGNKKPDGYGYPAPKAFIDFLKTMWEKMKAKKPDNAYPTPGMQKAILAEWPNFCKQVANIYRSEATSEDKASQLAKAVEDLRAKVEAAGEE
jgi:hypothetical protein